MPALSSVDQLRRMPGGSVVKFFVLTYAVTWTFFISVAAAAIPTRRPLGALLVLLGAFAPSLVALWLTARAEGGTGIRTLRGRVLQWRVAAPPDPFSRGHISPNKGTRAVVPPVGPRARARSFAQPRG